MASNIDITVLSGVSAGDVFHFHVDAGTSVTIGRATECDIVLHDPTVSRHHVHIERRAEGIFIVDEGSTHGTFHMGFQVEPGPDGARRLRSDDEFKIGDLLFRVSFDESEFAPKDSGAAKAGATKQTAPAKKSLMKSRAGVGLVLIALLLLVLFFLNVPEKGGLPAQRSNEVLSVPNYGVVGYIVGNGSTPKEGKDRTHLDKAQFDIPASDVLIEYSIISEGKITVLLDDVAVEQLEPSPNNWQMRQIIVRGVALGKERRLVFDNLEYPMKPGQSGPLKQWGVRDLRAVPLTSAGGIEPGFDAHLNSAIGMVEGIDKGPSGLFLLMRALQVSAVELLKELKIDEVGFIVDPGAEDTLKVADVSELQSRLQLVKSGRERDNTSSASAAYLQDVTKVISQIDAELWRRVNNHMSQAKLSSKVKNYIDAHDQLVSTMAMFPNEEDYRWSLVNRLYMDNKIVPKRVRQNPGNFRK
ncbi:MAG: FHA domain-containing protein [Bdellovibrionota bacterium]